jgi:hypothetical protein
MHGQRQELRFSIYSDTLENAVLSVLHVFEDDWTPFEAMAAVPAVAGVQPLTKCFVKLTFAELSDLIKLRFQEAAMVHQAVFFGRENTAEPSPWVMPVLADMANSLGIHLGQR